MYDVAKSIGANDPANTYGGATLAGLSSLSTLTSHMMKNSEWGAASYLASSRYGAGIGKVQINGNSASTWSSDVAGWRIGVTGCGPQADGSTSAYDDSGELGTNKACGGVDRGYNGVLGVLASTTGNTYGVYDMSGGAWEYVMGAYAYNGTDVSSDGHFVNTPQSPYVDLYVNDVFTADDLFDSNNQCTWETCGGQAMHETKNSQLVNSADQSWMNNDSRFANSGYPWFKRSGSAADGAYAGLFYTFMGNGDADEQAEFRIALIKNGS